MEFWLPIIFVSVMGIALLAYVILDGYDLGIGMLLPLANEKEKDSMIAAIGPFWDANETWIVLGIGVLLIAFPQAHGIVLTSLYIPVTIMLFGLILRGVAFDFRVKAGDNKRKLWNQLFFVGSLTASVAQGWMLGDYITGLGDGLINTLFALLIAITLPALYVMLGASWLLIKSSDELLNKAVRWARVALLPMGIALLLVSIATPIVSTEIAEKWFTLPNAIGLLPIPLTCGFCFLGIGWMLGRNDLIHDGHGWVVFAGLAIICLMAALGLAYSIYPWIILGQLTIFESASATASLEFALVGVLLTVPMIVAYTIFVYWIFRGKAQGLSYE
ncbi:cytochrome d ubiquinol oxidase subunit II [Reinekea sp.]|uniref:cytochrome d ubiquinol oxidase subunit II n=1 Tax=Reinekea sp. TaxID=1970455 RepID=UPI00257BD766|nr:cytochrome d ubiquinol oxidase subunit II [Reinekea sp.]